MIEFFSLSLIDDDSCLTEKKLFSSPDEVIEGEKRFQCPSRRQKSKITSHDNAFMVFQYLSTNFKYLRETNFYWFFGLLLNNRTSKKATFCWLNEYLLNAWFVCFFNLDLIQIDAVTRRTWNGNDSSLVGWTRRFR